MAAFVAWSLIEKYTVIDCSPASRCWSAPAVASSPVVGMLGSLRAFSAEIVELAIVSLAARTPSILLLLFCSSCSKIVSACWPSQLGTACWPTFVYSPESNFGLSTSL